MKPLSLLASTIFLFPATWAAGDPGEFQSRCHLDILIKAGRSTTPEKFIPPAYLTPDKRLRLPTKSHPSDLCDAEIWRVVKRTLTEDGKGISWIPRELKDQVAALGFIDAEFHKVDEKAQETSALAKDILATGAGLGFWEKVEPEQIPRDKQAAAVLSLISYGRIAGPGVTKEWSMVSGDKVRRYHAKMLELRSALYAFGENKWIDAPQIKKCLVSDAAALTPRTIIPLRGTVAQLSGPCIPQKGGYAALNSVSNKVSGALSPVLEAVGDASGSVYNVVMDVATAPLPSETKVRNAGAQFGQAEVIIDPYKVKWMSHGQSIFAEYDITAGDGVLQHYQQIEKILVSLNRTVLTSCPDGGLKQYVAEIERAAKEEKAGGAKSSAKKPG